MIDQLSDSLQSGWRIPFSNLSVIDAGLFAQMLERMRINVPSTIIESERTLAERDQILAEARAEAQRILEDARQRSVEVLSDESIVVAARQEAERIIEDSRAAAEQRAAEADAYAMHVLEDLAKKLGAMTKQVDNGIEIMRGNRLSASADGNER